MLEKSPAPAEKNTYEIELPTGDKVEIGDRDSVDFKPNLKLKRWGEECSLNLSIPTTEKIQPTIEGEKILWEGKDYGAEFYLAEDNFKFNIILPKKPLTNVFPLDFSSDNLKFFYQPPLTDKKYDWEKEFGEVKVSETQVKRLSDGVVVVERPEKVVGSYVAYHATRGAMHPSKAEAEKYKTGQALFWYRPLIYDNAGHTCWGELNINPKAGLRTVTIPQDFLDNAVYPVTIDDDFGYKTEGGSSALIVTNQIETTDGGYTGAAGTGTSMSMYGKKFLFNAATKMALYKVGDDSYVQETDEFTINSTTPQWWNANFASNPTLSAIDYYLVVYTGTSSYIYYNDTDLDKLYDASESYDTWPNPASWTATTDKTYSIYCTYTPSGAAGLEIPIAMHHFRQMVEE